ncbi:hypothetical protein ZHAS_00008843 [Anopheles sinensis]|uniref:Uncharacterized protein n=1 Tax=Anopheles sinensis TaxID=74873 RepID=A0A084VTF9_ANOSI|nr:hypothetical protein ZHAS_00008843 [Anopheles sinensis]
MPPGPTVVLHLAYRDAGRKPKGCKGERKAQCAQNIFLEFRVSGRNDDKDDDEVLCPIGMAGGAREYGRFVVEPPRWIAFSGRPAAEEKVLQSKPNRPVAFR